jgi:hypothetical protein
MQAFMQLHNKESEQPGTKLMIQIKSKVIQGGTEIKTNLCLYAAPPKKGS